MTESKITVDSLDHLVLTVSDIERTVHFYTSVLGMEAHTFDGGRVALHFGVQKINLHEVGRVIDPNVRHATPGSADLCFLTQTPMAEVSTSLASFGVPIIEGPVRRTGAQGPMQSVYVYDPDENLVEIAVLEL
jgi:catechol 2,3-dioxygenase-like lactoylglutathione lyase family enzyme